MGVSHVCQVHIIALIRGKMVKLAKSDSRDVQLLLVMILPFGFCQDKTSWN